MCNARKAIDRGFTQGTVDEQAVVMAYEGEGYYTNCLEDAIVNDERATQLPPGFGGDPEGLSYDGKDDDDQWSLWILTFAMSLYSERGYEMPRMSRIMTARRFVRSHRNESSESDGKRESMTTGIVSPTMTQNATMPPKALSCVSLGGQWPFLMDVQQPLC
jgi:hypothetical protein